LVFFRYLLPFRSFVSCSLCCPHVPPLRSPPHAFFLWSFAEKFSRRCFFQRTRAMIFFFRFPIVSFPRCKHLSSLLKRLFRRSRGFQDCVDLPLLVSELLPSFASISPFFAIIFLLTLALRRSASRLFAARLLLSLLFLPVCFFPLR